jgi:hypothetical protein
MERSPGLLARAGRTVAAALVAIGSYTGIAVATATPANAQPSLHISIAKGLDSCTAPSLSQMSAFWSNTPYAVWGVYIGGADRACGQPNLTSSWVASVTNQGWGLLPIWVGPQNPCLAGFSHFSTNTSTAYSQGQNEAISAYNTLISLGISSNAPIIYDMEGAGGSSQTCINATKSFIQGWTNQLHVAPAQSAGIYTSTCGGFLDQFAFNSPPPDFIDGADWDGNPSTSVLACVSGGHWTNHQRHKQYQGGHNETWNGVTLNVDSTCSNGPVVSNTGYSNSACL